jgi:hypothetical protein
MTNYLSMVSFIYEDIVGTGLAELEEFSVHVRLLEQTLRFFRSIYTSKPENLRAIVAGFFELKKITLSDEADVFETVNEDIGNVICGILYVTAKFCKSTDVVSIKRIEADYVISMDGTTRTLPVKTVEVFEDESVQEDAFNVFAKYIVRMASDAGCKIAVEGSLTRCQRVILKVPS